MSKESVKEFLGMVNPKTRDDMPKQASDVQMRSIGSDLIKSLCKSAERHFNNHKENLPKSNR